MRHPNANATQRARRSRGPRVEYAPRGPSLAVLEAVRAESRQHTNQEALDRIVREWAHAYRPEFTDAFTCARMSLDRPTPKPANLARVVCGATRHRDGQPCEALSVPGKRRCRFHGGMSTGPRTAEGRAKVARNLPRRDD